VHEYRCRKCNSQFDADMVQLRCSNLSCPSQSIYSVNEKYIRDGWNPIDYGDTDRDRYEAGRPITEIITLLNKNEEEDNE
jgi:hypothetical protein